jgi:integrase
VANLKASIIEKIKVDGAWKSVPVKVPKAKPNGKGFYLRDRREGKFLLVWREGGRKQYSNYILSLPEAIQAKEQKEIYLASSAKGLKVEDPTEGKTRPTVNAAIDEFLTGLSGRGNTVATYKQNLKQFQRWNSGIARQKRSYLDQIDRQHIMAFKKYLETDVEIGNDEYTAAWKCIRVNKMIKTVLKLGSGQGPVKKSDFSDVLNRKPAVTTYRKDERDKFLATCKGVKLIIWTLFLKCGLRLKELSHIEWSDIDFVRRIVRIDKKKVKDGDSVVDFIPKKWSIRDIAIPSDLMALLL